MKFEFSAGGVVYKKEQDKVFVLIGQHSGHHGWVFPKGIIGDHIKGEKKSASAKGFGPASQSSSEASETKEQAALREVKEETGITGKIEQALTPVVFWYQHEGVKIKKTVYYFVMKYVSGDTKDHDWEMTQVQWVPFEDVEKTLTYASDKKVWLEAKQQIAPGL